MQYQGGHILGFSGDEPNKPALMIAPLLGKSAFVDRLVSIYSLKADFLFEQLGILIKIIHSAYGFVFFLFFYKDFFF